MGNLDEKLGNAFLSLISWGSISLLSQLGIP